MPVSRSSEDTLAVILAGGQGARLGGLTRNRCKPALPFGAHFRSIDFTLSNCANSGLRHIGVATQYKGWSLIPHLQRNWGSGNGGLREPVAIWRAEAHHEKRYSGTADAVYKNLDAIDRHAPRFVLVLAADHVYRMNYAHLLEFHQQTGANVTVACQPVPPEQARHFGIMSVRRDEIRAFQEKPTQVDMGGNPLASMGIYVFDAQLLRELLVDDARRQSSRHDFGRDIIPACVDAPDIRVCAHPLRDPCTGGPGYWCDIGTVDAYWNASMELLSSRPSIDLKGREWPIRSMSGSVSPILTARQEERFSLISDSLLGDDCKVEGAIVRRSVVSSGVSVAAGSVIEDCVLLPGARVGANCRLRRAIVEEGVEVPAHYCLDGKRSTGTDGCEVSPGGVAVLLRSPVTEAQVDTGLLSYAEQELRQRSSSVRIVGCRSAFMREWENADSFRGRAIRG